MVKAIVVLLLVKPTLWTLALSKQIEVSVKAMSLLSVIFFRILAVCLNLISSQKRNISTYGERKMVIFSIRRKQTLLRQQWLQDPREWQQVGIWLNSSHELSLGVRIYSAREQQQVQDWTPLLYIL